jgi:hypothetical protein
MNQLAAWIATMTPCPDALVWLADRDDLATVWAECDRADYMLWLLGRMAERNADGWPSVEQVARITQAIALAAIQRHAKSSIPISAIRAAADFLDGKATANDVAYAHYLAINYTHESAMREGGIVEYCLAMAGGHCLSSLIPKSAWTSCYVAQGVSLVYSLTSGTTREGEYRILCDFIRDKLQPGPVPCSR